MPRTKFILPALLLLSALASSTHAAQLLDDTYHDGDFKLVHNGIAADILIDPADARVVHLAADLLTQDIQHVTSLKPRLKLTTDKSATPNTVIIGTLHHSPLIDTLVIS